MALKSSLRARVVLVAVGAGASLLFSAPSATALVTYWEDETATAFSGYGCGDSDSFTYTAERRGAFDTRIIDPGVGDQLYSPRGTPIAGVVDVRSEGNRATITVAGNEAACQAGQEEQYWETARVRLDIEFVTDEPVYFGGDTSRAYVRPQTIYFGASQGVYRIRWSRWGGRVATGRGTYFYNDCNPYCARGRLTPYGVAVRLSRRRWCDSFEAWLYMDFQFTYLGRRPRGTPRHTYVSYGC